MAESANRRCFTRHSQINKAGICIFVVKIRTNNYDPLCQLERCRYMPFLLSEEKRLAVKVTPIR